MKLLLIEDDKEAAKYLIKGLREHGYVVDHSATGKDGLFLATTEKYDAMIIDRMVPEVDGLTIIQNPARQRQRYAGHRAHRAR
jgi:two-component system OmpR family response regulator